MTSTIATDQFQAGTVASSVQRRDTPGMRHPEVFLALVPGVELLLDDGREGFANPGDIIAVTAGMPFGIASNTNLPGLAAVWWQPRPAGRGPVKV